MKNFQIPEEKKALMREIIRRSISDASFKERLLANPRDIFEELDSSALLNDNREVVVVDQTDTSKIFINLSLLSFKLWGGEIDEMELTEEELEMVAGGISCFTFSCDGKAVK